MQHKVQLSVNGKAWGGWTTVRLEHGITQLAQNFELTLTERWPQLNTPREINVGDRCELLVNDKVELVGFVDDVGVTYGSREHNLVIAGRDKTGDIIDSSAPLNQFNNVGLLHIATTLCAPFGIDVSSNVDLGKAFKSSAADEGASIFEFIEGLARQKGVILTTAQQSNIVITQASNDRSNTSLRLGENILRANALYSDRDRFNTITVLGQLKGDDFGFGPLAAHQKGSATDANVRKLRKLLFKAEIGDIEPEKRAQLEASVRYGESRRVTYTIPGWFDGDDLWRPNRLVDIDDAYLKIHDTWLIVNIVRRISNDAGIVTGLTVMPKEAFSRLPIPEEDTRGGLLG